MNLVKTKSLSKYVQKTNLSPSCDGGEAGRHAAPGSDCSSEGGSWGLPQASQLGSEAVLGSLVVKVMVQRWVGVATELGSHAGIPSS